MATQVKYLNNKKVQMLKKGVLTEIKCLNDVTKDCTWECIACPEPISEEGMTYLTFRCQPIHLQFVIPDADFEDSR
jgi:hypothetical protein